MSKESIQGPLSALRNAGTVCGVCLTHGSEVLVNLFPFSEARISDVVDTIDDIQQYFHQNGRQVDQMSLGYDGGCLCVVEDDEFRLIVMHMLADEVDFISKAARAFLADFHLDLFKEQIGAGNTRLEGIVTGNSPPAALMTEPAPKSPLDAVRRSAQASEHSAAKLVEPSPVNGAISDEANSASGHPPESSVVTDAEAIEDFSQADHRSEAELSLNPEETAGGSGARLAENQPESTLPPPRRPRPPPN